MDRTWDKNPEVGLVWAGDVDRRRMIGDIPSGLRPKDNQASKCVENAKVRSCDALAVASG